MKIKTSILFLILFFIILPALHTLELDDQKMAAFFNSQVPRLLVENKFAGMVVCLVHNGKIIYSKGFGYSDIKSQVKVDPAKTLFRAGSVSKLFTWTAVMQLVEQGIKILTYTLEISGCRILFPNRLP
jgi:CubicO group peptidase (beta-lactamase class C family)